MHTVESFKFVEASFRELLSFYGSWRRNFMDLHICMKDNPGMSLYIEYVNSCRVRGIDDFHEN
jgi:hypothetical protein